MSNQITKTLVSTKEGAVYIGCSHNSLRISRMTGKLFSVQSPAFIKMGSTVRYKLSTLDVWLSQFEEQANTAQVSAQ